ncbi:DUF6602 domain-containing protein [Pseudogracilibacillus sp. SO30301A]|uniref:DUF6602 domain-containing protein n=1 Tax=Pseudogracilibacillus sp. SO30301A TaxID=3098291 RepID=UPI00300E0DEE
MNSKVMTKLVENYRNLERTLITELWIDESSNTSSAEEIWQPVFKRIIPTKYSVEKNVYIIDSYQGVSEKVSLAVYDEQYTPYIFNYGTIKYIPIEAVFAVVLCENKMLRKQLEEKQNDQQEQLGRAQQKQSETLGVYTPWLKSIQELKTDMNAYVRIQTALLDTNILSPGQTQTSTRPITILCTTAEKADLASGFDIILSVCFKEGEQEEIHKHISCEDAELHTWYESLNHYNLDRYENKEELKDLKGKGIQSTERTLKDLNVGKNNVLLSLMFQFNQLLMLINNPIFFPHQSYVRAFNRGGEMSE